MRAKLIDLGRNHFNEEVKFSSVDGLLSHVTKHLMSQIVDIIALDGSKEGEVIVGGFRAVGRIKLLDCTFRVVDDAIPSLVLVSEV
jgi:hypothetical protein